MLTYRSLPSNHLNALHQDTRSAASPAALALTHLHLALRSAVSSLATTTATLEVTRHLLVVTADLAHDVEKRVVDIDARLGGRLDEFAAEGLC